MAKSIVVFDHDIGSMEVVPLQAGGFLTLCEHPMYLASRMDNAEDGSITLVLKLRILPPSEEGKEFLQNETE